MEEEFTGLTDKIGQPIYHKSILRNFFGNVYMVKLDETFFYLYVLYEVFDGTVEVLHAGNASELVVIADTPERAVAVL